LTPPHGLWFTLITVMRSFSDNAIVTTGFVRADGVVGAAGFPRAISIPVIRISGHNVRAGIGA